MLPERRTVRAAESPRLFDLRLPPLALVRGGTVEPHHARGWWWGPAADLPVLEARTAPLSTEDRHGAERQRPFRRTGAVPVRERRGPGLDDSTPTVLLVHALTGDSRAGGTGGWWEPLVGPGRALDPARVRILCLNNLGSCYGSSGPTDAGFPPDVVLSSWDIARALLLGLDALGVERLALAGGGSLAGMVVTCLAALEPARVERLLPIAASAEASAWVVGWNHVGREVLRACPGARGLELARQIAMLTYRAEAGLEERQPRSEPPVQGSPHPYRVQGYLEHQGVNLARRFEPRAYLLQLDAMDHHDLLRPPAGLRVQAIRASALCVGVDTDQLFSPALVEGLAAFLAGGGAHVERATLRSPHGHDAFLIEWAALAPLVSRALALPEPPR